MVCACGLEFLKTFMRIFVMFVNEEVCEIALIISSSTDYELSAAFFIFKALMFTIIIRCLRIQTGKRIMKD